MGHNYVTVIHTDIYLCIPPPPPRSP